MQIRTGSGNGEEPWVEQERKGNSSPYSVSTDESDGGKCHDLRIGRAIRTSLYVHETQKKLRHN